MFFKRFGMIALLAGIISVLPAQADDDALLDLLVRKHLITKAEAAEVRAEMHKQAEGDMPMESESKLKLSKSVTELELSGDARVRYEVRNGKTAAPDPINPPGDTFQRDRPRYRLRIGLKGTLVDDWFFGLRLETGTNPRSTNVTFGDDTSGGPGPSAKNSDGINVGQVYFGYKGFQGLVLTAGKVPNPLVTSSMVWDGDINPEGLTEQYKYTIRLGHGTPTRTETLSGKDSKTVVATEKSVTSGMTLELFTNLGQFVYDDTNPENPVGPSPDGIPDDDAYLLAWQVGAKLNFDKNSYIEIAPTLYNYSGTGDTFSTHFVGDPVFVDGAGNRVIPNQTGANSLLVFELPGELTFKVGKIPVRIFVDFAVNLDGSERARAAGHPDKTGEKYAYQVGAGIGSTAQQGDISLTSFWQHAEQFALDPNLVDSDIFDSRVNMEGVFVQLSYAVTNAVTANLVYAHGWQIDHNLGTGGVGDLGINPVDDYNLFQVDLSFKF